MLKTLILAGFVTLGLVQLLLARWLWRRTRSLVDRGVRVPARTVGSTHEATVDTQGARYDRLEFTAADGRVYPVSSRVGVPWSTTKGRAVTVIYDPADPSEAVLERWIDLWMPPLILGLAGGMMIVAMAVLAALDALGVIQANF